MAKRIVLVALVLVVAAGIMYAGAEPGGIARELAMGGSNFSPIVGFGPNFVLNPFIYDDPTNMLINPAYQQMYKNYAWMNIAGGAVCNVTPTDNVYGRQFSGVNFASGKDFTLGAVLSFDPSFTNLLSSQLATFIGGLPAPYGRTAQTGLAPIDVFEVVGTIDLGTVAVGVGVMYGWATNELKNQGNPAPPASSDYLLSAHSFGFRAGATVDMGGGSAFGVSGAIRLDKATDNEDVTGTTGPANQGDYSASATEIQLNARLKLKMSNKVNFVPYVGFGSLSGEPKVDAAPTGVTPAFNGSYKLSGMLFGVGAGMEYKVSNFYLAGGVSFKSSHYKIEAKGQSPPAPATPAGTFTTTVSTTELPVFNLGFEWKLLDWLTGRMGYYRTFASKDVKDEVPSPGSASEAISWMGNSNVVLGSYNAADNGLVTLGVGLRFGNFALDGTVSEDALRRGLGLIGAQDNINTFGYLTASYCFD